MKGALQRGLGWALVAMVVSGVSVYVNKFAVGEIDSPLLFTTVKNSLVGVALLGLVVASGKLNVVKKFARADLMGLILVAVIGGAVPFYLFFTGLSQTSAVNAQLINKSLVLWVALLAIPWLKEKMNIWQVAVVGLIYSSNLLVGGFGGFRFSGGELMILVATWMWAVEHVVAKRVLERVDPMVVAAARMAGGAVLLIVASIVSLDSVGSQLVGVSSRGWLMIGLTAMTLTAYVLSWYRAMRWAPVSLVATVLTGATVVTTLLTTSTSGQVFTGAMVGQMVVVMVGIGMMSWLGRGVREGGELVKAG